MSKLKIVDMFSKSVLTFSVMLFIQIGYAQVDAGYNYFHKDFTVTNSSPLVLTDKNNDILNENSAFKVRFVTCGFKV